MNSEATLVIFDPVERLDYRVKFKRLLSVGKDQGDATRFNQQMAKSSRVSLTQKTMNKVSPSSHMLCGNSE